MSPPTATAASVRGLLLRAVVTLILAFAGAQELSMPSYLHVCKASDPKLGECMKESVEGLRPRLAAGIPELNVPPLEPLRLEQLDLTHGAKLKVVAKDVKVFDTTSFQLRDITVNDDRTEFRLRLSFPSLHVRATYTADGQLLTMPMHGTGPLNLNATDVDAEVVMVTAPEQRSGESFLALKELQVLLQEVRDASVRLDNLFGGDPMLGEVVNAAVNAHFPKVLEELRPALQKSLQDALQDLVAKILATYPTRMLFPED